MKNYMNAYYSGFNNSPLQSSYEGYGYRTCISGAVYDEFNFIIRDSIREPSREDHVLPVDLSFLPKRDSAEVLRGRSVFLGPFYSHYGHFLIEGISRLNIDSYDAYDNLIFSPFIFGDERLSVHDVVFDIFSINTSKVAILREPVEFESIDVSFPMWRRLSSLDFNVKANYQKILSFIRSQDLKFDKMDKIFLSMRSNNRFDSISLVEVIFQEFGFNIVYPEELNFSLQVLKYSNAKVIAGFSGSSMHNVIFADSRAMIIELGDSRTHTSPLELQLKCNELVGINNFIFIPYGDRKDEYEIKLKLLLKKFF